MKWLTAGFILCQTLAIAIGAYEISTPRPDTTPYVANWEGPYFHDPEAHCVRLDQTKPVTEFIGYKKADDFGEPCPHCLSELARSAARTASLRQP